MPRHDGLEWEYCGHCFASMTQPQKQLDRRPPLAKPQIIILINTFDENNFMPCGNKYQEPHLRKEEILTLLYTKKAR